MLYFDRYRVLTFDCYGTLIDWESGILSAVRPALENWLNNNPSIADAVVGRIVCRRRSGFLCCAGKMAVAGR